MTFKDKQKEREYRKEYEQRPEVKKMREKYRKEYCKNPRRRKYLKKYRENHKEEMKEYWQEYKKEFNKKRKKERQKPENKLKQKEYREIPEVKKKKEGYLRGYRRELKIEENKRRKKLGLALVGEGFKTEMELLVYVHNLFQDYEILTHHKKTLGDWGKVGLELDIYIPELKLAFEYNGLQHYEQVDYFHSKEEFETQQYRDRCKKKICKLKGITLIKIKYDEKLSEQLILTKLIYHPFITNQGNFE